MEKSMGGFQVAGFEVAVYIERVASIPANGGSAQIDMPNGPMSDTGTIIIRNPAGEVIDRVPCRFVRTPLQTGRS